MPQGSSFAARSSTWHPDTSFKQR